MRIKTGFTKEYTLTAANIDAMSEAAVSYLESKKIEHREILKVQIALEDALLNWQEEMGKDKTVTLDLSHRMGREMVTANLVGEQCNPLKAYGELGEWTERLRSTLEDVPSYDYLGNINIVTFSARKKPFSRFLLILIFLALGLLIGVLGNLLIAEETRVSFCESYMVPVYSGFLSMFTFCGVPLIFLSVLTGILGVGNVNSFNLIGRSMVIKSIVFTAAASLFAIIAGLLVFPQTFGSKGTDIQYTDFLQMILDWIPKDPFDPFIECNAMQLVVMGTAFGMAILLMNGSNCTLAKVFCDCNTMLLRIMSWITLLIPLFVCITLVKSIWMSELGLLLLAWRSWLGTTFVQLIAIYALSLPLIKKYRISFINLLKKVFKVFVIACGSCTCTVSIPANYDCCEKKLGINHKVFVFGIPIGTSIFKPATAIRVVFLCYFVMWSENIPVSFSWLTMLFIMAIVMSIATPAIPGGTLMLCSMLFAQLGMPDAVLAQMLTTDVFFDCICIAFNQIAVSIGLASFGCRLGLVDTDLLKK